MTIDKRHRNSIYSIILFIVLCSIVCAIQWDTDFAAAEIFFVTEAAGFAVGLIFLILKLLKATVSKTNFIYNYFGILNSILGLLTFFTPAILFALTHLFIGIFILHDIFKGPYEEDSYKEFQD